jgi:hypothetical protein
MRDGAGLRRFWSGLLVVVRRKSGLKNSQAALMASLSVVKSLQCCGTLRFALIEEEVLQCSARG